jgi:hypothetical protein
MTENARIRAFRKDPRRFPFGRTGSANLPSCGTEDVTAEVLLLSSLQLKSDLNGSDR